MYRIKDTHSTTRVYSRDLNPDVSVSKSQRQLSKYISALREAGTCWRIPVLRGSYTFTFTIFPLYAIFFTIFHGYKFPCWLSMVSSEHLSSQRNEGICHHTQSRPHPWMRFGTLYKPQDVKGTVICESSYMEGNRNDASVLVTPGY